MVYLCIYAIYSLYECIVYNIYIYSLNECIPFYLSVLLEY